MREIKFRAWNKVGKFYVNDVQDAYDGTGPDDPFDNFGDALDDDNYVVEQFTGLTDVNGKEIYEGDIVHGYDQEPDRDDGYVGSSVIDVVNFENGAFWIGDSWYKVMVMTPPIVEVIGNVHTNPELLEEEK